MTHYGLICPAASGHLNPMTTLGYELKKQGHRVTVFSTLDAQPKTLAAGLDFEVVGASDFPAGTMKEMFTEMGKLSGFAALRYTINFIRQGTEVNLRELPQLLKASSVDALIVDQVSPEGGSIAEFLDLPFISCACALMLNRDVSVPPFNTHWQYSPNQWSKLRNWVGYQILNKVGKPIRETINDYRSQWNLLPHTHPNDHYSKLAQISQSPAEFEFPRENLPDCFHFTGAYNNPASREPAPFPFEKLTEQPIIYASMGTIQNRLLNVFYTIAEACAGLDAQLIISLGGSATPEALPGLPGSPLVVGYAPQLELLQKAELTITHAGMNTALESLTMGVPMVAIPITNDQPGVAARIAWTGCGEFVALKELDTIKLRTAIQKVLTEKSYKENALRLQAAIKKAGGVSRAIDIIEQVVSTGKSVIS